MFDLFSIFIFKIYLIIKYYFFRLIKSNNFHHSTYDVFPFSVLIIFPKTIIDRKCDRII